jgi:hypothetical protein
MPAESVLLVALAALAALLLLVRAVLAQDEPWWVAWPLPVAAVVAVVVALSGPAWLLVAALTAVAGGLCAQLWWAYRGGRYVEDDVAAVWRRARGRPAPSGGRHRRRDESPGDDA